MLDYFVLLAIGVVAGTLGSMVGLGGGIIMLPATQLFLGFDLLISVGTTLFAVIFTSLSAAIGHFRAGNVRLKSAGYTGLGGLLGVLLGSYIFKQYLTNSVVILKMVLGIFFILMAYRLGREAYNEWVKRAVPEYVTPSNDSRERVLALLALGFFTGIMTGMLGIGGGFILTPGIMFICAASPQMAVGTTMLAMLPLSLSGGIIKLWQGYVNLPAGIILGLGTALGAQAGVWLSSRISATLLKAIFTLIFTILAVDYLYPIFLH